MLEEIEIFKPAKSKGKPDDSNNEQKESPEEFSKRIHINIIYYEYKNEIARHLNDEVAGNIIYILRVYAQVRAIINQQA